MRNTILTILAGASLACGIFGATPTLSYISTGWTALREKVTRQIPINFEIERAKDLLASTADEVKTNIELIAKSEKELSRLDERIVSLSESAAARDGELRELKEAGGTKGQLVVKFASLKRQNRELVNLNQIKEAKAKNLEALKLKLDDIISTREQLAIEIQNLETRYTLVQTNSELNVELDDSSLNDLRQLVDNLDARIAAEEQTTIIAEIDVETDDVQEVSAEEVEAYLAQNKN